MKNLDLLIPKKREREPDTWQWATVTAIAPLRIRLDGETAPLDITPDNTLGTVGVGDRVWTQTTGRRILVVGKANGLANQAINLLHEGVVADNVADDAPALRDAIEKAKAENRPLLLPGGLVGMRLNSTVDARYVDAQFDSAIRIGHNSGPGIIFGGNAGIVVRRRVSLTTVSNVVATPANPSVRIVGAKSTEFFLGAIDHLQLYADASVSADASLAYCTFLFTGGYIPKMDFLGENGSAWINDNKFIGGRFKDISFRGSYPHNGNKFYGATCEGANLNFEVGSDNIFDRVRFEGDCAASFAAGTWANEIENSFASNSAAFTSNLKVTDLGVNNVVSSHLSKVLAPREVMRIDSFTRAFNLTSEYPQAGTWVPGLRSLRIRTAWKDIFDSGILPIEHTPDPAMASSLAEESASRVTRFHFASSHKIWRPRVYCYDENMTLLDPTAAGKQYISSTGGWTANADGYYGFGNTVNSARLVVLDPTVKHLRFALASSLAAGTAFDWASLTAFVKTPHLDAMTSLWQRAVRRPLYQSTAPTEGAAHLGETVGQFTCTSRVNQTLAAAAATSATTVTLASAAGVASEDRIGVLLANGTTHWTTVSGAPSGAVVTLAAALPSDAASGSPVVLNRWV